MSNNCMVSPTMNHCCNNNNNNSDGKVPQEGQADANYYISSGATQSSALKGTGNSACTMYGRERMKCRSMSEMIVRANMGMKGQHMKTGVNVQAMAINDNKWVQYTGENMNKNAEMRLNSRIADFRPVMRGAD